MSTERVELSGGTADGQALVVDSTVQEIRMPHPPPLSRASQMNLERGPWLYKDVYRRVSPDLFVYDRTER